MAEAHRVGRARSGFTRSAQLGDDAVEAGSLDILHDVIGVSILVADAEDGDDVGMVQPRGRLGFPLEPPDLVRVVERSAREDFQRHSAAECLFLGFVDHTHSAAADRADDPEAVNLRWHG